MSERIRLGVYGLLIAAICALPWIVDGQARVALDPFFQSPAALWSTVGIAILSLSIALYFMVAGLMSLRREKDTVAAVHARISELRQNPSLVFKKTEPDVEQTFLLGALQKDSARRRATNTGKILALIYTDARYMRFEPVHLAIRTQEASLRRFSAMTASTQTLAIRAGILGTFVGLILSLGRVQEVFMLRGTQLSNASDASSLAADLGSIRDQIGYLMGGVVQDLALSFGTSISGIVSAMLIVLMAAELRARETKSLSDIQRLAIMAQAYFRDVYGHDAEIIKTVADLNTYLKGNLEKLGDLGDNIHNQSSRLEDVSRHVGEGLAGPARQLAEHSAALGALLEQARGSTDALRAGQAQLRAAEAHMVARLEVLPQELDRLSHAGTEAVRVAIGQNGEAVAQALSRMGGTLDAGIADLGARLSTGIAQGIGKDLRAGVVEGFAARRDDVDGWVRDMMVEVQRQNRRESRRAFTVYALAILVLSMSMIVASHGERIASLLGGEAFASSAGGGGGN